MLAAPALTGLAAAAATACCLSARAQTPPITAAVPAAAVQTIVVTAASRGERAALDEPVRIDSLDAEALEAGQVTDLRDLARALPNVSVPRQPARFGLAQGTAGREGNAGLTVRGLGANRVAMVIDGLRLPRSYGIGANAFGRDHVDFGVIDRIELVRGPASALYGSDSLAGVLAFTTRSPSSFLKNGRPVGGQVGLSYSGDDDSLRLGATVAVRASERFEWLVSASALRGHALDNQGSVGGTGATRTEPNPQDDRGGAALFKGAWKAAAGHASTFTLEANTHRSEYEILSGRSATVLDLDGSERRERQRASVEHHWQAGLPIADELRFSLGVQRSESRQFAAEDRATAADRQRDARYRERSVQASVLADKSLPQGRLPQRITYGMDVSRTKLTQYTTGVTPPAGETFPLKRFPDTTEQSFALFAQDEITHGRVTVTPGLRWDHYRLSPRRGDPLSLPDPASLSDSALSPKLAALWRIDPVWRIYGQFATGFRAPSPYQLNEYFENPAQFYRSIPNPDLKPEKSRGFELGVKAGGAAASFEAAVFHHRYRDFIDDRVRVGGTGTAADPMVFQSVNRARARIRGFELKGDITLAGAWQLRAAYGYTRGRDDDTGQPLNSVDPARLTLGAAYDTDAWRVGMDLTHRAAKHRKDIDSTGQAGPLLATGRSTVVDLTARWTLRPGLRLSGGLYNLTDRKVLDWANVAGVPATTTVADAYTSPGRHAGVTLVWDL
ncbi:TonB-dependent hemoglobin/transferrin/lactoferrin family receptor [Aquincola sp. MAHUQ-54]|uniref:TonB-dependent hemoglobin/transferrin/lactoferrin family receptor n=1 Tax=Aquincola agrisoli TaxID=3119538 RepID=A0AAW9Q6P1_9BURK